MRLVTIPAVGVGIAVLGLAAATAGTADAHSTGVAPSHRGTVSHAASPMKKGNCYSNLMQDSGIAVLSQTFGDMPDYDSASADNFAVKKTCKVTGIYAPGQYFNGSGPADSETVTFYADDAGGVPGTELSSQTVIGRDRSGTFTIPLDVVTLAPGSYWVTVSANMNLSPGGEWGWEVSTHQKQGIEGQFENPGGGFGVCPTWAGITGCVGVSGDYMFTLTK